MRNAEFYIFNTSNENRESYRMVPEQNDCRFDRLATLSPLEEKLHKLFHL